MALRNFAVKLVGATDTSLATDWFPVGEMAKFSAISNVTGDVAAAGTVTFEVSNETSTGGGSMMSFTPTITKALSSPTLTIAGNTTLITSITDLSYQWMRVVFTRSAGSGGVLTVLVSGHD
jgi:hypothetical protein